jgi:hypothetical protein
MDQNPYEAPQTEPSERDPHPSPPRDIGEVLRRLAFGGFPGWLKVGMLMALAVTLLFVVAAMMFGAAIMPLLAYTLSPASQPVLKAA